MSVVPCASSTFTYPNDISSVLESLSSEVNKYLLGKLKEKACELSRSRIFCPNIMDIAQNVYSNLISAEFEKYSGPLKYMAHSGQGSFYAPGTVAYSS